MLQFVARQFSFLVSLGEYVSLMLSVSWIIFSSPPRWRLIREQLYTVGVLSLTVVSLAGFSTGLVLAAQSFYQLQDKGLASLTGLMVAKSMLTELGPLITGFMVTGRIGAAMTAELASMRVTEQIDALKSMSVDPYRYLIAPRYIATIFMFPLLTTFSIVMGVFGGYLIAIYFFKMSPITYWEPIPTYVTPFDFMSGFVKAIFFGILIVSICCFKGLKSKGGAQGVGKATTSAVVICYICILFCNFLFTLGLNVVREEVARWLS